MSSLREAAQAALDEWRDDPGSVRMASLMMALQNAVFEDEQRSINAKQLAEADAKELVRVHPDGTETWKVRDGKAKPMTTKEMSDWEKKTWDELYRQAWKDSHE